jgi:alpha-D-ribose 1-methylphosphonate 5-triphosphate synthase subunit PhnH
MWSASNPGRLERLPATPDGPLVAAAKALIDLETTYYSPDATLAARLARTGARSANPREARYQFYPQLDSADLAAIESAPTGTYSYPDNSATILIRTGVFAAAADLTRPVTRLRLSGPGVPSTRDVYVSDVPVALWAIRARAIHYPLGWDLFLIANEQVVGIPRTTVVEVDP